MLTLATSLSRLHLPSTDRQKSEEESWTKMAREDCHVVLIAALLASARLAAGAPDWATDLRANIDDLTRNINRNIQEQMHQLQLQQNQLQRNLNKQLAEVNEQIENLPTDSRGTIQATISDGHTMFLTTDGRSTINGFGGGLIISNGRIIKNGRTITSGADNIRYEIVNDITRIITSGRTPDGEPYVRRIEERSDEKYLYHNETSYNPKTNQITEKIRWRLDRTTPGATPENLADEK